MTILLPQRAIDRRELSAWLRARGFVCTSDDPVTDGARTTIWRHDDDAAMFVTRAKLGTAMLKLVGPGAAQLAAAFERDVPSRNAELLLTAPEPSALPELLRHTFELAALVLIDDELGERAKMPLFDRLEHPEALVRWAALSGLVVDARGIEVLERAAARYPEMTDMLERLREAVDAQRDGTLGDTDTDDRHELLRRAREGAQAGQWRRVAKAMDVLLEEDDWDNEAWFLRGLAHAGEGELIEAMFMLGAVVGELDDTDDDSDDDSDDDDDGDDDIDDDDIDDINEDDDDDDDDIDDDDDEKQQRLATARAELERLRPLAAQADADAQARAGTHALRWLGTWMDGSQLGPVHGAASAARELLPELDGLLTFLVARWDHDAQLLARAEQLLPDAPSVAIARARALLDDDPEAAAQAFERVRAKLRASVELSPAAAQLEQLLAREPGARPPSEAGVLETLANYAYEAQDWDRAAALADELVTLDPDRPLGWQIRANARIFALRHEQAVDALSDAITELARIDALDDEETINLGADPRVTMIFNRACVLAKLGRREAALDDLRQAIRQDDKFADDAPADDYFAALFDDPEFQAICAQDPLALLLASEREPAFVEQLLGRSRELENAGELQAAAATSERACMIAEALGAVEQLAEARGLCARHSLFLGDGEAASSLIEQALELLDRVHSPRVRAGVHAQHGIVLQALGELDAAEAAFTRALELRREAFGDEHPDVVKSMVALVGVARAREDAPAEIEARLAQGIDHATRCLDTLATRDHVWAEVLDGLVSLLVQRACLRAEHDQLDDSIALLGLALDRLDEQREAGFMPLSSTLDELHMLAEDWRAASIGARIEAMLFPGPPEQRGPRLVFHRLRGWIRQLRLAGVEDARIAEVLTEIVRGGDELAEELRNLPVLVGLRNVLAAAAARESTILVTSAMALSLAAMPGQLDESLVNLEELIVPLC